MEEIICYTRYLPKGEQRKLTFMELLLDDRWADGRIECPESFYSQTGNINGKLAAKQNYEFLLRAAQKYPLRAVGDPGKLLEVKGKRETGKNSVLTLMLRANISRNCLRLIILIR